MSLAGRAFVGLVQSLRGSRSLKILRGMETGPRSSRAEILADQFRRLSALLSCAEAHVPYYREVFRRLGISSSDIRTLRDFSSLPVLTKEIIRQHEHDLVREDVPKEKLLSGHSGGSTGVPLKYCHNRYYDDAAEAGTFRNLLQCGWKPGETIAYVWGGNDLLYSRPRWQLELLQFLRRRYYFDPFYSGPAEMDCWMERWTRIKPSVAYGYASTIARFAAHVQARGMHLPTLKGVFTTAEKLYQPQRDVIATVFGCRVYDCYGSSEVRNIAAECPNGRMHVNTDFVVLEVDRTGVARGEPMPFIVTSLQNSIMPFIRYRIEDCGQLQDGTCDCGNQAPLMHLNIARISDHFTLPGGRIVHGEFFTHLMYGSQGISMFQFHQTAPDSITLWIVPGPGDHSARDRSIRTAVERVKNLDPISELKVHLRMTEAIPLSGAGKHRFIRSDLQNCR